MNKKVSSESFVKDIRRRTRKKYSSEEKIRIVLEGFQSGMSAFGRKQTLIPLNFLSNAYQLEAMINVLERKGILTGKEVLDELKVILATKRKTTRWQ